MLIIILLLFMCCSCNIEIPIQPPTPHHTLLVYMAGDNNLSNETFEKIDSITSGWTNTNDNLLIYQDAQTTQKSPMLLRVVVEKGKAHTEVVQEYPDQDSSSPNVLSQIIHEVTTLYPAKSYGLLVFSHATGWLPNDMYLQPRAITNDNGNTMDIKDFATAIPSHQFQYIVFEACLMAGVEVACELKDKTDYLVVSSAEILSPGFTEIYPQLINYLFEPEPNLTAFAKTYYEHVNTTKEYVYRSATISVIRTSGIDRLIELTAPILTTNPETAINTIQEFNSKPQKFYFDFGNYLHQLATPEQYKLIEKQLEKTVIYKNATPSFISKPIHAHSGLTIYIPQSYYPVLNQVYKEYSWHKLINQ